MRGQSSVEFMVILAAFLTILSTFTIPQMINPARSAAQDIQAASQARIACDEIASAINGVSASSENATNSLGITFFNNWALKMESDPPVLRLGVQAEEETLWMESKLMYGFNQKISGSAGTYTVIIERGKSESVIKTENKVFVTVNPSTGGGKWRY